MSRIQIRKLLTVALIATIIMLVFEAIFSVPQIVDFFTNCIINGGAWVWVILWIIMFLQVTILNIPAYTILAACTSVGMATLSPLYIVIVLSAYMCGAILAYMLGRKFGVKATKWVAGNENEFTKWCEFINKKGKWFYFLTIVFPFFPDDLLCLVAGSVKMNFGFYTIANLIGRGVGLITMILVLKVIKFTSGNFPWMLIVWGIAFIIELVALVILNNKEK